MVWAEGKDSDSIRKKPRIGIPMSSPRVAIIVLNWNNWRDTLECLASLDRLEYQNHYIWIVDNGSRNDSCRQIIQGLEHMGHRAMVLNEEEAWNAKSLTALRPSTDISIRPHVLIRLEENYGYAGGNNRALELAGRSGYDYVWLLNNDTRVSADALRELVNSAERDERVSMVVSNLVNIIENRAVQDQCHYLKDLQVEVESLAGGSILVRTDCLADIGLIDEKYFCYGEELDWSLRARRRGWKLIRNYRSIVFHKWGSSTQSKRIEKKFLGRKIVRISWQGFLTPGYYESRNGIYFMKKNQHSLWVPYAIFRTLHLILQLVLYDDHKWGRMQIVLKGAWDGVRGRMGKTEISL